MNLRKEFEDIRQEFEAHYENASKENCKSVVDQLFNLLSVLGAEMDAISNLVPQKYHTNHLELSERVQNFINDLNKS